MKKRILISCLFITFCFLSHSINGETSIMIEEVYTQLKLAIGDQHKTFPKLEIRPGASSVLSYNKKNNIIFVDKKALEVCRSFGYQEKDAFAFLLAHEMTHFYQEHSWQEAGFATSFLSNRNHFEEHLADEKEADLFGAFITHIAGYRSIKIIPDLFDRIYNTYGLTDQLIDYPSLTQRKATAFEVCEKVKDLIQIFETANHLMLLGEYMAAISAYEYILNFVKYKELYNNVGASLFAAAALQNSYDGLAYRYPIELDLDLPLREGVDADQQELLDKAIEYLTIASTLDNQHYPTFLHLAAAFSLKKQYHRAETLINQLQRFTTNTKHIAELAILQGIIQAQQNNKTAALKYFSEAMYSGASSGIQQLAIYNQQLVEGITSTTSISSQSSGSAIIEGIDITYQNDFSFKTINISDNFSYEENLLSLHQKSNTTLIHLETNRKIIAILSTTNPQEYTSKNIGINATVQQINNAYPEDAARIINHSKGYFLLLPTYKLFFSLNAQDQVISWGTFEFY